MSKWRPAPRDCIYVIPDIHGALGLLTKICDRILPLRKSDGGKDKLIFLGDYIDRHVNSHKVVDALIALEKKYGSQVVFLMGNHELMFLQAMNLQPGRDISITNRKPIFNMWMANGGAETVLGYLERAGLKENPLTYPQNRILDLFPKQHIEFFQRLVKGYEFEEYVFVHGGLNPLESVAKQDVEVLAWDRSLLNIVMKAINADVELSWDKIVVTGHNVLSHKRPIIKDKFMMLDCGSPSQLLVVELRTMEAYMAAGVKTRLVKYELKETTPMKSLIRRVSS